ncbi:MAG: hypothetical protein IPJ89_04465 [Candidatus Iainarchaeum archaeon]|uniref:Uncharacterized protein n=1 Tax=Candidatus Iainarchaeum sp. TaxID=3101447 RepID=A0A7T9DJE1_9ARCH|nr:MAG: hypothetical protein IPJ89_04465 [Candidatus Diapherotrites archaeon]
MAERSTGIILIIALIIIAGGAWYFFINQPASPSNTTSTSTFTDGFSAIQRAHAFPMQGMDEGYFTRMLDMTAAEQQTTTAAIRSIHDSLITQSNDTAYRLSQITSIINSILAATDARGELNAANDQILALELDDYCDHLPLFTQRDQAGERMLTSLRQAQAAIQTFVNNYPAEAAQLQLTTNALQFGDYENDMTNAKAATQSLAQACTGGI